jgi:NAD(P)-dependent dehydrogenase (short-subunit alcohol dehydrogenase family)
LLYGNASTNGTSTGKELLVATQQTPTPGAALTGKVALITGTGGGQGRAAALQFAAAGARVMGCDVKDEGNAETIRLVQEAGGEMTGRAPVDLSDPEAAKAWVDEAVEIYGAVDIVYNNASAARFASIADMSIGDWQFTMRNEVDIVFHVTRAAWPHLVSAGGGVIINTASLSAWSGSGYGVFAHCATKGAVLGMTRALAVEGGPHGIRCVSISPGPIETPGTAAIFADANVRAAMESALLVDRLGTPDDIAALAVFLASPQAAFINGADVLADGGLRAR